MTVFHDVTNIKNKGRPKGGKFIQQITIKMDQPTLDRIHDMLLKHPEYNASALYRKLIMIGLNVMEAAIDEE